MPNLLLSLPRGRDFCSAFQPSSQGLMVAAHTLLAAQLHLSTGSADCGRRTLPGGCIGGRASDKAQLCSCYPCLGPPPAPSKDAAGANYSFLLFITLSSLSQCESVSIIILNCLSLGELQVPALDSQMGLTHPSVPKIALSSRYSLCSLEQSPVLPDFRSWCQLGATGSFGLCCYAPPILMRIFP